MSKPFFNACSGTLTRVHFDPETRVETHTQEVPYLELDEANRLVEPLLEEIENWKALAQNNARLGSALAAGYEELAADNPHRGSSFNEDMLKHYEELAEENERLRGQVSNLTSMRTETCSELVAMRAERDSLAVENERLRADVKRLGDIYLRDETGKSLNSRNALPESRPDGFLNEFIQVVMLKEKLLKIHAEIEQAPVVYCNSADEPHMGVWRKFSLQDTLRFGPFELKRDTHKARLVRIVSLRSTGEGEEE